MARQRVSKVHQRRCRLPVPGKRRCQFSRRFTRVCSRGVVQVESIESTLYRMIRGHLGPQTVVIGDTHERKCVLPLFYLLPPAASATLAWPSSSILAFCTDPFRLLCPWPSCARVFYLCSITFHLPRSSPAPRGPGGLLPLSSWPLVARTRRVRCSCF